MSEARFLGIDFSGAAAPWRATCSRPTVWVAVLEGFQLVDLRPVQKLDPGSAPFDSLVKLLRAGQFRAAGIDAPFSLPDPHCPSGGHARLLEEVGALPPASDRPFPLGRQLIELAERCAPKQSAKPYRAERPIWPWKDAPGMLAEAFPAAQLQAWNLPHVKYTGADAGPVRTKIIAEIQRRHGIEVAPADRREMQRTPDALDAFIATFAGRAAANRTLKLEKPSSWKTEGAIAIHV
jgi:hypothetical protein